MFSKQSIKDLFKLSKVMISISVTYSALAGYVIAGQRIDISIIPVLLGVYILSSGASAFNQIAERKTDALMNRTQNRPIPSGRISLNFAYRFAIIASLIGCILLIFSAGWIVALLGIINLLWYNLVYTPLKKRTVWAVFVGTITGVIPFYMGYLSAVNEFPSHYAHFIAFFLLIWQIPHFFLLLGIYGKEYELAGLASITKKTNEPNLFRLSALWLIANCIFAFSFPVFKLFNSTTIAYITTGVSVFVFIITLVNLVINYKKKYKLLFIFSNVMQLVIITCVVVDRLLY